MTGIEDRIWFIFTPAFHRELPDLMVSKYFYEPVWPGGYQQILLAAVYLTKHNAKQLQQPLPKTLCHQATSCQCAPAHVSCRWLVNLLAAPCWSFFVVRTTPPFFGAIQFKDKLDIKIRFLNLSHLPLSGLTACDRRTSNFSFIVDQKTTRWWKIWFG